MRTRKKRGKDDKKIYSPKGSRDILFGEYQYYNKLENVISRIADNFGYYKISLSTFENLALYEKVNKKGDKKKNDNIVSFKPKGKSYQAIALRADLSISLVRAYVENGFARYRKPVKIMTFGSEFATSPQQKGTFREIKKCEVAAFGRKDSLMDVQMIQLAYVLLRKIGIKEKLRLRLNNCGCKECRKPYKKTLFYYLKTKNSELCRTCKRNMKKDPFVIFDCQEEGCVNALKRAPHIVNSLCESCDRDFKRVIRFLTDLKIDHDVQSLLRYNRNYNNKTIFAFDLILEECRIKNIITGGRKDGLVEDLGAKKSSFIGFKIDLDKIVKYLSRGKSEALRKSNDKKVFIIGLGEMGKREGLRLYMDLLDSGLNAQESFGRDSIKAQLSNASKSKARFSLIIGQKEALDEMVIVRDMICGSQETMLRKGLIDRIRKMFGK